MSTGLEPLATAVYNKLTSAGAFNTAMGGRIYFEEYKSADGSLPVTFPYCVYFFVSDVPQYTFNTAFEAIQVQVSVFDKASSATSMLSYLSSLHALMDYTSLTVTGWNSIVCERSSADLQIPDDDQIRQGISTYDILIQKI
ncbi:MAG: hypothetical protein OEY10_00405 [Nitrosopumilus sp.]|nr:hypothetical protein [Nitrosopumilus sp.]